MSARAALAVTAPFLLILALACDGGAELPFGLQAETVAEAGRVSAIAPAADGRVFFGEQLTGVIRVVGADGQLQQEPFAQIQVATWADLDWGLTGLALDPDFPNNHYVYVFYSAPTESPEVAQPRLVRFTERGGKAEVEQLITDDFPETDPGHQGFNANGQIHFGPDGFLYVSVGDYDLGTAAGPNGIPPSQDLSLPIGKLLRIDGSDGSAPPDNPFAGDPEADPRVFAYGFREPFPFTFHPETGAIYGTDNTPVSCEELNIIEAGENYSWPDVGEFAFSDCSAAGQKTAVHYFSRTGKAPGDFISFVEVSGLAFASGDRYPAMGGGFLICESLRSKEKPEDAESPGLLRQVILGGPRFDQFSATHVLVRECKGDVAIGPDGTAYFSTASKVIRLVGGEVGEPPPPEEEEEPTEAPEEGRSPPPLQPPPTPPR